MDSKDTRFSGKVYTPRKHKTLKKEVSTAVAASNVTKISETLDADKPVKVVPQTDQNHFITNSTSGDVPEAGVELRENGSCSGGEVVTISLNEWKSICEIINVRRRLEGQLHHVRRMLNKIEVKETSI
ncbi:hypothetical protein KY284_036198 [Solanum tuberosum]|nr:hypothetical protein KY284_036198 [Solanum tuberosum]